MMEKAESKSIIDAITNPLGFFVLALLIVETFLGSTFFASDISAEHKIVFVWLGAGMFVLVITVVAILVWFKADNITFDNKSHLIDRGRLKVFGTSDDPVSEKALENAQRSTPKE